MSRKRFWAYIGAELVGSLCSSFCYPVSGLGPMILLLIFVSYIACKSVIQVIYSNYQQKIGLTSWLVSLVTSVEIAHLCYSTCMFYYILSPSHSSHWDVYLLHCLHVYGGSNFKKQNYGTILSMSLKKRVKKERREFNGTEGQRVSSRCTCPWYSKKMFEETGRTVGGIR